MGGGGRKPFAVFVLGISGFGYFLALVLLPESFGFDIVRFL